MKFQTKKSSVKQASQTILDHWQVDHQDPYRPGYHPIAPHGWINDPNGLVFADGWYHVFYQWNPYGNTWGNMHWGHMRSRDLHQWEHLPVALAPDQAYDRDGCFSGSAVNHGGDLVLFYTANVFEAGDHPYNAGPLATQTQALAISRDGGIHFDKLEANPVIGDPPTGGTPVDFRDPKVHEVDNHYLMVLGSRQGKRGEVVTYRTANKTDLTQWTYLDQMVLAPEDLGYMWECPDLLELGDKQVLLVSPMGAAAYDGRNVTGYLVDGVFCLMDQLPRVYAPQTFSGLDYGLLLGWLTMPDLDVANHQWNGCLTLPRKLDLSSDNHLVARPVLPETAYGQDRFVKEDLLFEGDQTVKLAGDSVHLHLILDPDQAGQVVVKLKASEDGKHYTNLVMDLDKASLHLDTHQAYGKAPKGGYQQASFTYEDLQDLELVDLDIYIDKSVVEIYALGGRCVFTTTIFSDPNNDKIHVSCISRGSVTLRTLRLRQVKPSIHGLHPSLLEMEASSE